MNRPLILVALFILLAAVRISSPVDLFEGDQQKQVGYVMDILLNGDWTIQYEVTGRIATKPPLYNWLAALPAMLLGSTSPWVMKLPSLLAGAGLLVLLFLTAERLFDRTTAFWATAAFMASHHFMKLAWFARTDMLMAFGVYLAFYLVLVLKPTRFKPVLIGLVMGVNYLVKGPAGPAFFAVLLLVWAAHEGLLFSPKRWLPAIPGVLVFLLIAGAYLAAVWSKPQFQGVVVGRELVSRMPGVARHFDPVYAYLGWLLGRAAPWPFVAAAGLYFSRRRPEWASARYVAWWALGILIFITLLPSKRHDYLLALYPPLFMLAGLGMRYATEASETRGYRWAILTLAGALMLAPGFMPLLMKQGSTAWIWLWAAGIFCCGALTLWCIRKKSPAALAWVCAGLILINGLYHHGLGNAHPLYLYKDLSAFTESVKARVSQDPLRVWRSHPLISYRLGLHQPLCDVKDLKAARPAWLITEAQFAPEIEQATDWVLEEEAALVATTRFVQLNTRLYRVH